MRAAQLLLLLVLVPATAGLQTCLPQYETEYIVNSNNTRFLYNLSSLCSLGGYNITDGLFNFMLSFNIGGDIPRRCSPDFESYNSRGAVIQFFSGETPACDALGKTCHDWDGDDPDTLVCCDYTCLVLATDFLSFSQLQPETPIISGFRIDYPPAPDIPGAPYPCAPDSSRPNIPALRTVALEVACNPSSGPGLSNVLANEFATCQYLITAQSADACPSILPSTSSGSSSVSATISSSPTASPTLTVTASPTSSSSPTLTSSTTASAAPKESYFSSADRDAGVGFAGAAIGATISLVSVYLGQRGACDCFRSQRPQVERESLLRTF